MNNFCIWRKNDIPYEYVTECGHVIEILDGKLENSIYKYCPICGKKIKECELTSETIKEMDHQLKKEHKHIFDDTLN